MFPNTRGIGFAVLEGPTSLLDWGIKDVRKDRDKNAPRVAKQLLISYQPDILVLEDPSGKDSHKRPRIRRLIPRIHRFATAESVETHRFGRQTIRQCFADAGASTKEQIATVIAARLPELQPHLPPKRKFWVTEHRRMGVFDAAALALTYYWSLFRKRRDREQ
jgi:Holliday junction resolvasome RuvABC endonuclease subunit